MGLKILGVSNFLRPNCFNFHLQLGPKELKKEKISTHEGESELFFDKHQTEIVKIHSSGIQMKYPTI
jgi:hypothetical protein